MDQSLFDSIRQIFARHPEIRLAMLFGSLAADRARHDSDLDLAVAAEQPLTAAERVGLIAELAEAIGRPVDLIDLHVVGEPLLGQILKRGRRILGSNGAYAELIKRHLFEEADFMPYRRRILAERRRAWIGK
ncbi:MAG TPA: nucleotidyltransferase domain-containing protein [Chromatiales bacterium]|nr:nucleotidyltransferase domain-containing protein [Chromatiales bacterium]